MSVRPERSPPRPRPHPYSYPSPAGPAVPPQPQPQPQPFQGPSAYPIPFLPFPSAQPTPAPPLTPAGPTLYEKSLGMFNTFEAAVDGIGGDARVMDYQSYSLVDGQSFFYSKVLRSDLGDALNMSDLTRWGTSCMSPNGARSKVIIVIPWAVWVDKGMEGPNVTAIMRQQRLQMLMSNVEALRAPGSSVLVCLLIYPYNAVNRAYAEVDGRANQPVCQMGNMKKHSHLACEVDDYFLSLLHCRLLQSQKAVHTISKDRGVIKRIFEQDAIRAHMRDSGWGFGVEVRELFWHDQGGYR